MSKDIDNIYKEATFQDLLIEVRNGNITVAQMAKLPLVAGEGHVSLDSIYASTTRKLNDLDTESYVNSVTAAKSKAKARLELILALVKDIIDTRQEMASAADKRAGQEAKLRRLRQEAAERANNAPSKLSDEEVAKELAALEAELSG